MPIPSHLLIELTSLSQLNYPSSSKQCVQYSCVDAGKRHLVVGSTAGAVYIFHRYAPKHTNAVPPVTMVRLKTMGLVSSVCINDDETQAVAATSDGLVCLIDMSTTRVMFADNIGACVTTVVYGTSDAYAGDEHGNMFIIRYTSMLGGGVKQVLHGDSSIVQIDVTTTDREKDMVLVSTMTRTHVYDASTHKCHSLGKSEHKRAAHGAVFTSSHNSQTAFVARPKARLWEAAVDTGEVYSTHKFTKVTDLPTSKLIVACKPVEDDGDTQHQPLVEDLHLNFTQLYRIRYSNRAYVVTWFNRAIYILDTAKASVKLVCNIDYTPWSLSIIANDIFVLTTDGFLHKLTFLDYGMAVEALHSRGAVEQAVGLVRNHLSYPWRSSTIRELLQSISEYENPDVFITRSLITMAVEAEEREAKLKAEEEVAVMRIELESQTSTSTSTVSERQKVPTSVKLLRPRIRTRSNSVPSLLSAMEDLISDRHGSESNLLKLISSPHDETRHHIPLLDEPLGFENETFSHIPATPAVHRKAAKGKKHKRVVDSKMKSRPIAVVDDVTAEKRQAAVEALHKTNCHVKKSWIDDARALRLGDNSTDFLDYLSTFEKFLQVHFHGDKSAKIRGSDNSHTLDGRICLSCRKIIRSLTQNAEVDNRVESPSFDQRRRHSIIFGDLVQPEVDEDFVRENRKTTNNQILKNVSQKTILNVFSAKKTTPKLLNKPNEEESTNSEPEDLAGSANKLLSNEILRLLITNVIRKQNGGAKLLNEVRKAQKTLPDHEKSAEFNQLLAVLLDAIMSQSMKHHHDVPKVLLESLRNDLKIAPTAVA